VWIESSSYKPDFRLIAKNEEADYCKILGEEDEKRKLIAPKMDLPPTLRELIMRETGEQNPQMNVVIKPSHNKKHRLANEGEKPDIIIPIDIGTPTNPKLYQ
jgi:hypothetical protein